MGHILGRLGIYTYLHLGLDPVSDRVELEVVSQPFLQFLSLSRLASAPFLPTFIKSYKLTIELISNKSRLHFQNDGIAYLS
jgi:hypothetical protein